LTDAGLSKPMAGCMADRMVDRLSPFQLNKLNGLKKAARQEGQPDHHRGIRQAHQSAAGSRDIGRGEFIWRNLRDQGLSLFQQSRRCDKDSLRRNKKIRKKGGSPSTSIAPKCDSAVD
jgi:hypothetical protein